MILKPDAIYGDLLRRKAALPGFSVFDLAGVKGALAGAARKNMPIVLQVTVQTARLWGLDVWKVLIDGSRQHEANVLWHLEGGDHDLVAEAVDAGFNSVKVQWFEEGRRDSLEKLLELVAYLKDRGVWVEGEPVRLPSGGGADSEASIVSLTDSKKAKYFWESVKPDALAVSIGTAYGALTGIEYVGFDLVEELEKELPGLVLTSGGGSGIAGKQLRKLAGTNVCKITFGTSLALAWMRAVDSKSRIFSDGREMAAFMDDTSLSVQLDVEEKIDMVR